MGTCIFQHTTTASFCWGSVICSTNIGYLRGSRHNHRDPMTDTELTIFTLHSAQIFDVAKKLRRLYEKNVCRADADDFFQQILLEAPSAIQRAKTLDRNDADAVRGYLYTFFSFRLRDQRKKLMRRALYEDHLASETSVSRCNSTTCREDTGSIATFILETLVPKAPLDIQELCCAYLRHGSWSAAGRALGWSNGRLHRTLARARIFFHEKVIWDGEFFDFAPM